MHETRASKKLGEQLSPDLSVISLLVELGAKIITKVITIVASLAKTRGNPCFVPTNISLLVSRTRVSLSFFSKTSSSLEIQFHLFTHDAFFDQKEALSYHEFYRIDAILDRKSRDRISNFEQERVNEHASNRKLHTGVELNHLAN